jgi:RNA polymerase sigma factor (sigma-70 family)
VAKEAHRAAKRCRAVDWKQVEPAELADKQDARANTALTDAVAKLPDVYREIIMLRFYGGQSCAEISHNLGVPLGTVTKRLSRAYSLLRERLRPNASSHENEVPQ